MPALTRSGTLSSSAWSILFARPASPPASFASSSQLFVTGTTMERQFQWGLGPGKGLSWPLGP